VGRAGLPFVLLVAMSMTIAEFVEVQKLAPDDLRARFSLPSSCDPAVTALTTEPAANSVIVAVECRAKPTAPPAPSLPRDRQRPSSPAGRSQ
jgi:hypothetical protein